MTSGPLRYYAPIQSHELATRRDLIPSEPDHPRAGNWYYALQLGPLEHNLPPIVANRWRRVTFIVTTGDRFVEACKQGQRPVRAGKPGWSAIREAEGDGHTGQAPVADRRSWRRPYRRSGSTSEEWLDAGHLWGAAGGLRFVAEDEPEICLQEIQAGLRTIEA